VTWFFYLLIYGAIAYISFSKTRMWAFRYWEAKYPENYADDEWRRIRWNDETVFAVLVGIVWPIGLPFSALSYGRIKFDGDPPPRLK
jgi:hypothetical protein